MIGTSWSSLLRRPRDWLRRRPVALSRHGATARKALAAALLVTAVLLAFAPGGSDTARASPVVITAHDVATGTTLRATDVTLARLPPTAVPTGALSTTDAAVGAMLAGSARAGEPLTDARIVDGGASSRASPHGADDDTATVPIRLSDPAISGLLLPGTRVDVVTADDTSDEGRVLASDATVVTVTAPDDTTRTSESDGPLVLIALPADTATRVAAASLRQAVTVTLR
ncbi:MAG: hypothetical protein GEV04_19210 [Actinophytocola sp.]|nr:hypothetical protein [Actinophytocola sp.]